METLGLSLREMRNDHTRADTVVLGGNAGGSTCFVSESKHRAKATAERIGQGYALA